MTAPLSKCPLCGAWFRSNPGEAHAVIRSTGEEMCLSCTISFLNTHSDGRLGDVLQKAARAAEDEVRRGGGRE